MGQAAYQTPPEEQGLTTEIDSTNVEIDWPRSLGFFGAIGAAVALELVPIPIAVFIAGVPFLKLLDRPNASTPQRFVSQVIEGAAKPVGGDSEGTIHWSSKSRGAGAGRARSRGRSTTRRSRSSSHGSRGGRR